MTDDIVTCVSLKRHRRQARHPNSTRSSIRPANASKARKNFHRHVQTQTAATLPHEALYTSSVIRPPNIESRLVAIVPSRV
ncbi:MAG: hypothetical protein O2945_23030, partial [Planctomycetota bacterium]|nr:hypothetical protein [Planctomycetota bacterium]